MNNHKIVCARAARDEFGDAFHGGISAFRRARVDAMYTRACTFEGHLLHTEEVFPGFPDEIAAQILEFLHPRGVGDMAAEGVCDRPNAKLRRPAHSVGSPEEDCDQNEVSGSSLQPVGTKMILTAPPPDLLLHDEIGRDLAKMEKFQIMARCRPLTFGYDSLTPEHGNHSVVVHDGRVHRDGRSLYLVHSRFSLDRVFCQGADNDEVFQEVLLPLLQRVLPAAAARANAGPTASARDVVGAGGAAGQEHGSETSGPEEERVRHTFSTPKVICVPSPSPSSTRIFPC